ncbi:hypothetical protein CRUP_028423 [Coryphaenoides rupestris]|nr:hypothetical protein CRUP_028423 [Coryphaenoides rupestris]
MMQKLRNLFRPWSSTAALQDKTVVITGANRARIIMACRDAERGQEAVKAVIEGSQNTNVVYMKLDLSDTKSIREFAEAVNQGESKLNILINNAGIMAIPYGKTADGFEMQIGVNHLGHFLLTHLLIDLIKRTGVTAYSLHPGVVQTELWRHLNGPQQAVMKLVSPFTKNSVQGAQTSIYCAVEPTLENESGGYYSDCAPASPSNAAQSDESAKKLWEMSCQLLSVSWD